MSVKRISAALAALAVMLGALLACGCTGYDSADSVRRDDLLYYIHKSGKKAYVCEYYWDLDPEHTDIYIPDEIDGAVVDRIGGFMGTGVPCPFNVDSDEDGCLHVVRPEEREFDAPCEWRDIVFTLHIGKNITDATYFAQMGYLGKKNDDGSYILYRPVYRMECDPDNPVMYSEDGMLYFREDGKYVVPPADMPQPAEPGSYVPGVSPTDAPEVSGAAAPAEG